MPFAILSLKELNYIPTLLLKSDAASFTTSKRQSVEKINRKTFFLTLSAVKNNIVSKICIIKEKSAFHFPKQLIYRYYHALHYYEEHLCSALMTKIVS